MVAGGSGEEFLLQHCLVGNCPFPLCKVGHEAVTMKVIGIALWMLLWKAAIQDRFPASFNVFPDLSQGPRAEVHGYFTHSQL